MSSKGSNVMVLHSVIHDFDAKSAIATSKDSWEAALCGDPLVTATGVPVAVAGSVQP